MTVRPHRVCIVGLGYHGLAQAERLLETPSRWSLVALVDSSIATMMRFRWKRPQAKVPFFREVERAVALAPDVIFVTTPAPSHVAVARAIVDAGYGGALLLEKPVSNSLYDAEELAGHLRERGFRGRVTVDHHRRCSGIYQTAWEQIRSGALGALRGIHYSRRCKLANSGVHFVDVANWYTGSRPREVTASLDEHSLSDYRGSFFYDPPGEAEVVYENGLKFRLDARGAADKTGQSGLRVELEGGELFIDGDESFLEIRRGGQVEKVTSDKATFGYNWIETTLLSTVESDTGFVPCSIEESLDSLAVVVAAHLSHQRGGQAVTLPLDERDKRVALRVT